MRTGDIEATQSGIGGGVVGVEHETIGYVHVGRGIDAERECSVLKIGIDGRENGKNGVSATGYHTEATVGVEISLGIFASRRGKPQETPAKGELILGRIGSIRGGRSEVLGVGERLRCAVGNESGRGGHTRGVARGADRVEIKIIALSGSKARNGAIGGAERGRGPFRGTLGGIFGHIAGRGGAIGGCPSETGRTAGVVAAKQLFGRIASCSGGDGNLDVGAE